MVNKNLYLFIGALVAIAYFVGRYTAPERIKIETKTEVQYVEKTNEAKEAEKNRSIIEIKKPDGTTIKRTRFKSTSRDSKQTDSQITQNTEEKKEIENRRGVVISALIGAPLNDWTKFPIYGAAFTKQFLGPIHLGAWGLTNLTVGISVGLQF